MSKTLYIIRGLPGAGKSTFADSLSKSLNCAYFEADSFHMTANGYEWKPENVYTAHKLCQDHVAKCMEYGHENVIVSNTSTTEKEMKPYLDFAEEYGYRVVSLIVENRHGNESVHNIPQETIEKMRDRFSVKL